MIFRAHPVVFDFGFLLRKLIERVPRSLMDECFTNSSVGPIAHITRLVPFCRNMISLLEQRVISIVHLCYYYGYRIILVLIASVHKSREF